MGLIDRIFGLVFGGNRNVIKETAEVFRVNAEAADVRSSEAQMAALAQFAAEFAHPKKSAFDVFIDGLNRIPRPAMALGTLALFVAAMADPLWFSSRMQGISLVPEPLWWLLGAVVSFYFGARHQLKGQEFQKSLAASLARAPVVEERAEKAAEVEAPEGDFADNAALQDWAASKR
ncbi:MAG: holin family protein [Pseudomonadota bacterium]